jgi:hypothetical protein
MGIWCDPKIKSFGEWQALVVAAAASPVNLTKENFKKEVEDSGKSAFVKFFAPWYVSDPLPMELTGLFASASGWYC